MKILDIHSTTLREDLHTCFREVRLNLSDIDAYSFQFLNWKRNGELKKHWLAHTKTRCLRCNLPISKKYTGVKKRRSFICGNCQIVYNV